MVFQLDDLLLQFLNVGEVAVLELMLYSCPHILGGIQVWTFSRPLDQLDVLPLYELSSDHLGLAAGTPHPGGSAG
jgi:hypothetical protein